MQYNLTTKNDLKEILKAAIEQEKWNAVLEIIKTLRDMERNGRETILIEIRQAPPR
jgi:hypothetical protein